MALLAVAGPQVAAAQESSAPLALEEVLVTARKREENLQTIPIAVSTLNATEIANGAFRDLRDIASMSPNLIVDHISASPQAAAISLRGINFQDLERSFEPTVGVVLDGIFLGTNSGAELQIFDMERIEVLRGPQGTLFGRNTIGGVINVIRTDPTGELGFTTRGRYGNYERAEVDAIFNFPVWEDKVAGKLTYTNRQQEDGYNENQFNGKDEAEVDYQSWAIDLLARPVDSLSVEYVYQRQDDNSQAGPVFNVSRPADPDSGFVGDDLCVRFDQCQTGPRNPQTGDRLKSNTNFPLDAYYNVDAHTIEAAWDFTDSARLTYLFGRIESDEELNQDYDGTDLDYFHSRRAQDYQQTSHELRLNGAIGERIDYVVGGYYWESDYQLDQSSYHLFRLELTEAWFNPFNTRGDAWTDHETESWAVFFETDWEFVDRWTLTVGGRYTEDDKSFKRETETFLPFGSEEPVNFGGFSTYDDPTEEDWSEFTPKASVQYQWTDELMVYLNYSKGYRSGGMNGRANTIESATATYDPEDLESWELGMKSTWFDDRLLLNVAAFLQDYQDKQEDIVIAVPPPISQETITVNASEASIDGVELDLVALPYEGWTLRLNVGLLDAEYDDFIADLTQDGVENPVDVSRLQLRRTPDYNFSINSLYEWQWGEGTAGVQARYFYRDDFETEFLNIEEGHVDGFGILDASVSYDWRDWRFSLFGRNLTDEDATSTALNVAGNLTFAAYRQPLTYGLEVTYTWAKD
jgi:iron complex outermembrane receptor protein